METVLKTNPEGVSIDLVDNSTYGQTTNMFKVDATAGGKVTLANGGMSVDPVANKTTVNGAFAAPNYLNQDAWDKPAADGSAAATLSEHSFLRAASPMTVKAVRYVPDAALTASDTVYATLTVQRRNADGTNAVQVAQINTALTVAPFSGNWVQWQAVALTLSGTAANLTLAAGQFLTISIAKASTGTVVPAGTLVIDYVEI